MRPPVSPEPRSSLKTSASDISLRWQPPEALQPPSPKDALRPLRELTLTQLSHEEFDELETACDTALERQRARRERERVARQVEARAAYAARAALAAGALGQNMTMGIAQESGTMAGR